MSLLSCAWTVSGSWYHLQAHPHQCPRSDGTCHHTGAEGTWGTEKDTLHTALGVRIGENHMCCYKTTAQLWNESRKYTLSQSETNLVNKNEKQVAGAVSGLPGDLRSGVVVFHSAKARSEVAQSVHMNHSLLRACVSHADQHHLNIWPRGCVFWG